MQSQPADPLGPDRPRFSPLRPWLVAVAAGLALAWALGLKLPEGGGSPLRAPLVTQARQGTRPPRAPGSAPADRSQRTPSTIPARRALRSLDRRFASPDGLFYKYEGGGIYAGAWAAAQALEGAVALSKLPGRTVGKGRILALFERLHPYWDGASRTPGYDKSARPPYGTGGYKFYDDNALIGLALIRAYGSTRDPAMLRRAAQLFAFETSGWDSSRADPHPGGVFWSQSPIARARNTVSTAGAAQLGLRLYLLSGRRRYLAWATRMYDWVNRNLKAPDGLYWDRVGPRGTISRTTWSYNQGLMLGAAQLLYRATGRRAYLHRARAIAHAALVLFRGAVLDRQRPIIDAIFVRNLLALGRISPRSAPRYLHAAERYARYLRRRVDPRTGVLRVTDRPELLDQAALLQVDAYIALARRKIPIG